MKKVDAHGVRGGAGIGQRPEKQKASKGGARRVLERLGSLLSKKLQLLVSASALGREPRGKPMGDGLGQRDSGSDGQGCGWEGEVLAAVRKGVPVHWCAEGARAGHGLGGLALGMLAPSTHPVGGDGSAAAVLVGLSGWCRGGGGGGEAGGAGGSGRSGGGGGWGRRGWAGAGWPGWGAASARAGSAAATPAPDVFRFTAVFLKCVCSWGAGR